jgi:hypothetical protein
MSVRLRGSIMPGLDALTDEEALITGLAVFVKARDLHKNPPKDGETLQALGISATNLDVPVRAWINAKFRKPRGWPLFARGDLTTDTTWSDFKKKVLTKSGNSDSSSLSTRVPIEATTTVKVTARKTRR